MTKLLVGGFKSIREQTEIPMAPLTFLFGPNSAGKSAVLAALNALSEKLVPTSVEQSLLSKDVQLAILGFGSYGAHQLPRHEADMEPGRTSVILGMEIDDFPNRKAKDNEVLNDAQRIALELYESLEGATVGIVFAGSELQFVSRVDVNGKQLLEFAAAPQYLRLNPSAVEMPDFGSIADAQDSQLSRMPRWGALTLHIDHPFWTKSSVTDKLKKLRSVVDETSLSFIRQALSISGDTVVIRTPVSTLHADGWGSYAIMQRSLMDICLHGVANESAEFQRQREELLQAMILVDLICTSISSLIERVRGVAHQELKFARVSGDRKILEAEDVKTEFLIPTGNDLSGPRIADYAAWLGVVSAGDDLCEEDDFGIKEMVGAARKRDDLVNDTLSRGFFPGRGYRVKPEVWLATNRNLVAADPFDSGGSHKMLDVSLSLEDANGRHLSFGEVGSGVSYVMPVLVSLWGAKRSWIEQPELHLHPAAQCEMGDVIIRAFNRGRFSIIETHSEHLLLRVLRRIRQTSRGLTDDPELRCSPEAVSILYFDPLPDGSTKVRRIRVSRGGDFMDRWPQGFFAERDQELFDE